MARKPPQVERKIILKRDQRRQYGARIVFQVQRPASISNLEHVTLLIPDGTYAVIKQSNSKEWEGNKRYEVEIAGFPTASEAESAGSQMAQALLVCAVSFDFGLRLNYSSFVPQIVYDRTISPGPNCEGELYHCWAQPTFLEELEQAYLSPIKDRRLLLSMELYAAATLESNDRTRFVMTVSALEPLAEQKQLGDEISEAVDRLLECFNKENSIPSNLCDSIKGRIEQLKRESVRQALKRLCERWFPEDPSAWKTLDRAYNLRSQLLHTGLPEDLDTLLSQETQLIGKYLRHIYQCEWGRNFRLKPNILGNNPDY